MQDTKEHMVNLKHEITMKPVPILHSIESGSHVFIIRESDSVVYQAYYFCKHPILRLSVPRPFSSSFMLWHGSFLGF
eukprot:c25064_g1_i1 orf=140-370(+)